MYAKPGTAESCLPSPSFAYAQLKVLGVSQWAETKAGNSFVSGCSTSLEEHPSMALLQLSVVKAPISNVKMSSDLIVLGSPTFQVPMCSTLGSELMRVFPGLGARRIYKHGWYYEVGAVLK